MFSQRHFHYLGFAHDQPSADSHLYQQHSHTAVMRKGCSESPWKDPSSAGTGDNGIVILGCRRSKVKPGLSGLRSFYGDHTDRLALAITKF